MHAFSGTGFSCLALESFGLTLKGISRIFAIHNENIPVIATPDKFRNFIKNVPYGKKMIAVVESAIFNSSNDTSSLHAFAISYEKQITREILYSYDSYGGIGNNVRQYFGEKLSIFTPNQTRQEYGNASTTCHAYAIRDARILQARIEDEGQHVSSDLLISTGFSKFDLGNEFICDGNAFKKELFKELILDASIPISRLTVELKSYTRDEHLVNLIKNNDERDLSMSDLHLIDPDMDGNGVTICCIS